MIKFQKSLLTKAPKEVILLNSQKREFKFVNQFMNIRFTETKTNLNFKNLTN